MLALEQFIYNDVPHVYTLTKWTNASRSRCVLEKPIELLKISKYGKSAQLSQ